MEDKNSAVAIFKTHVEAEKAVKELQQSGYDMKKLSIVGRDRHSEDHVIGYYNAGDRMKYWGSLGAFWGGLWGLLFGAAVFWIPGLGPLVVGGPLVSWILAALEGAAVVGGLSALGAGLYSIGVPKDSILKYEREIASDHYLLVAHGTKEEVWRAKNILETTGAHGVDTHVAAGYVSQGASR
jgi:hypothetical protein